MANTIPCPNPVCTHQFSAAELQSAAQLACPKCGFRMQGKGPAQPKPATASPKPAPPQAKPVVKAATPVKPKPASPVSAKPAPPVAAAPPAAPVSTEASVTDGDFFNPNLGDTSGALVRTNTVKRPFNWMKLLIIVFAFGFALSVVTIGLVIIAKSMPDFGLGGFFRGDGDTYVGNIRNLKNEKEKVYRLALPKSEWAFDGDLASRFNPEKEGQTVVSGWKYLVEGWDFWFVITAKDYGMHRPRDAEMLRYAVDRLEAHFVDGLELAAKAEPMKFGNLQAQKLQFRGEVKSVRWLGEVYLFFNNGIAYWVIAASPDGSVLEYFADALPEYHVFVANDRKGWREQPLPTETFASIDDKLDMTAIKGIWISGDPKAEDPNAKLLLTGKYLRAKDNRKNAHLLIMTMNKKEDAKEALKAAREQLEAREKDSNDKTKIVHAADVVPGQPEQGTQDDIGNRKGRMVDLKKMIGDEPEPHRYYLLSVINDPDTCYVIVCECSWASRQIWRQDFVDVLRTLKVK